MRLFPVLLALAVSAAIYLFVMERDFLRTAFGTAPEAAVEAAPETASAEDARPGVRVLAMRSEARPIATGVVLRGQTQALREVEVRAETSARVISEPLPKGTFVEAGQEMCRLDPGTREATLGEMRARLTEARARATEAMGRAPETAARIAEAEARLEEALSNENAAVQLARDGFAADTRVKNARAAVASARAALEAATAGTTSDAAGIDSARAGIESAEAAVAAARTELSRLSIRAPFAGLLEDDTAELGTLLQPGALCGTVIQLDPIKLVAFVPETEVDRLEVGAQAAAELASAPGRPITGQVTFLSRSADPTTRTFRVEIDIPNPDLRIRDGQTAQIVVATAGARAHLVPPSATTLNDAGTHGVRIVTEDNTVAFARIRVVNETTEGYWVTGLPDSADIIIRGHEYVTEGVRVAPVFEEPKT